MPNPTASRTPDEFPRYVVLSGQLYAGELPVILAARISTEPEEHAVIALSEADARYLFNQGRLKGWEPV